MMDVAELRKRDRMIDLAHLLERPRSGSGSDLSTEDVLLVPERSLVWRPGLKENSATLHEMRRLLAWLESFPGTNWQERWVNAGADHALGWLSTVPDHRPFTRAVRGPLIRAVGHLFLGRVVLPSYDTLLAYRANKLYENTRRTYEPEVFAALDDAAVQRGVADKHRLQAQKALSKIVLHTGRSPSALTGDDVLEMYAWALAFPRANGKPTQGLHLSWELLSTIGGTPPNSTLAHTLLHPQRTTTELVDNYQVQNREIRDVLIRYLEERRLALDYNSFRGEVAILVGQFWCDLEKHHPGLDTLRLPEDVASAWRDRIRVIANPDGTTRARTDLLAILSRVRGFYLDLQRWALEDASWARWAVPSPVRKSDCRGFAKAQRAARTRMHQRIRDRMPHLQILVDTAHRAMIDTAELLSTAQQQPPGTEFTISGRLYQRFEPTSPQREWAQNVHVRDLATGEKINITHREDERFWAWAAIETLRHTGIRIEELLELTQLAIVSYQLPDTGELVPLLQIVPSKNNEERLLLVSPELASVLATIVTRLRSSHDGTVPLIARFDTYQRDTSPPLPHLFQRQRGWRRAVASDASIRRLINEVLALTGLRDGLGNPLAYTPHDFRRIFATEAVTSGLPVHIAARLLGHASLDTTQAYVAVFQDDLVRTYRAFLAQRRAIRPADEYRDPTDEEWTEFQQHFLARKLELGTCGRPYGSSCQHEHACIRCPVLRVDPRQRARLVEIANNLRDRIREAELNGWRGEIDGLTVSLKAAHTKLAALDRHTTDSSHTGPVSIGMPVIRTTQ